MKVLVLAAKAQYTRLAPDVPARQKAELVFADRLGREEDWLAAGADAEALFVTPVTWIRESLIERMPALRLIHSDGVGYDRIDIDAARRRGIDVCSCAGCNAGPVAELAVTLMGMLVRRILWGDRLVKRGEQEQAVAELVSGTAADLSVCTVGLVGFGDIAQATAKRLRPYGTRVCYYAPHRRDAETEAACGAEYRPLETLLEQSDIVSLHLPATRESAGLVNDAFLHRMKRGSFLVNTARGAIVDDGALERAIRSGQLAGAALDCYVPEPVPGDHPLVRLAGEFPDRLILCPHQGGIACSAFARAQVLMYENLQRLMDGRPLLHVVN